MSAATHQRNQYLNFRADAAHYGISHGAFWLGVQTELGIAGVQVPAQYAPEDFVAAAHRVALRARREFIAAQREDRLAADTAADIAQEQDSDQTPWLQSWG